MAIHPTSSFSHRSLDFDVEKRSAIVSIPGLLSWFPAALTAIGVYTLLLAFFLAAYKHDPAALACIDPARVGTFPFEEARVGLGNGGGYDGQFYYAVARNPWRFHGPNEIDQPARHVRVLYPALAWLLSYGNPEGLFWALPLVNLLALGCLAALGAVHARSQGISPWWGLLLTGAVCGGLTVLRDLTDLVSSCAIAALLIARMCNWPWIVILLAAAAALFSREQNLVVVGCVWIATLWERRWFAAAGLAGVAILWGMWVLTLRLEYGTWPLLPSHGNLSRPLKGLSYACAHLGSTRDAIRVNLFCLFCLASQIGLLAYLSRWRPDPALFLVGIAGAAVVVTSGEFVYQHWWAYMRVQAWLPLALWLGYAQTRSRWALAMLALPGLLPFYHTREVLHHAWATHTLN